MPEISTTCTLKEAVPQLNLKVVVVITPAAAATGDTIDMKTFGIGTIYNVVLQADDGAGGMLDTTWDTAGVITLPTITTGIHHLTVIGKAL